MSTGAEARRYLRAQRHGAVATISSTFDGYPFGSIARYALDHAAQVQRALVMTARKARKFAHGSRGEKET